VVVGHRVDGTAGVVEDGAVDEVLLAPRGHRLAVLWGRDDVADLPSEPTTDRPAAFLPAPGGWRVALLTFAPDASRPLREGEGVVLADLAGQMAKGGGNGMHTTASVDVVLVLSGELRLVLADGTEVAVAAGETIVQNGTRHAWRNPTGEPVTVALFMAGAHHRDA
jgi:quercetin dioxygenase-like cupin family protein